MHLKARQSANMMPPTSSRTNYHMNRSSYYHHHHHKLVLFFLNKLYGLVPSVTHYSTNGSNQISADSTAGDTGVGPLRIYNKLSVTMGIKVLLWRNATKITPSAQQCIVTLNMYSDAIWKSAGYKQMPHMNRTEWITDLFNTEACNMLPHR